MVVGRQLPPGEAGATAGRARWGRARRAGGLSPSQHPLPHLVPRLRRRAASCCRSGRSWSWISATRARRGRRGAAGLSGPEGIENGRGRAWTRRSSAAARERRDADWRGRAVDVGGPVQPAVGGARDRRTRTGWKRGAMPDLGGDGTADRAGPRGEGRVARLTRSARRAGDWPRSRGRCRRWYGRDGPRSRSRSTSKCCSGRPGSSVRRSRRSWHPGPTVPCRMPGRGTAD